MSLNIVQEFLLIDNKLYNSGMVVIVFNSVYLIIIAFNAVYVTYNTSLTANC